MEGKMKGQIKVLKTTVVGGIVFLVPINIVVAIVGKAFDIMKMVADPLSALVPIDTAGKVAFVNLIAIALIVLVCFLAGHAARTETAARFVRALETKFLAHIPVYAFVKGMTASIAGTESEGMTAVLVRLDDYSQIAFEVERLEGGDVAVYLPGAPNPWSGSVCIMTEDRVQPIDASMMAAVQTIRHLGKGSGELRQDKPQTS